MNAKEVFSAAAIDNQAFSLMARLHVILRRQSGRVIDIEYMRIDPKYSEYVLALASNAANEETTEICDKLREIFFGQNGLFAHKQKRSANPVNHADTKMDAPLPVPVQVSIETAATTTVPLADAKVYVGSLR